MNKNCPKCDGPMVSLMSQSSRLCVDCLSEFDNKLKPKQKALIKHTR